MNFNSLDLPAFAIFHCEMSEIDSEILILEVEKHPCLYDLGNENYKNRTAKMAAWMDVYIFLLPGY